MQAPSVRRRGTAAVLAMLYLVLFSTLAIGFYAATTTSVQVVANERNTAKAQMAAESGMEFVRYQLAHVRIPHGTLLADLYSTMYANLEAQMNNTGNAASISQSGAIISIPAGSDTWIALDSGGSRFRATIENLGQKVRVKVIGRHANPQIRRAVQMDYDLAMNASQIFDYGIASRGQVTTDGVSRIKGLTDPTKGSILSTTMTNPTPVVVNGLEVSGDVSVTNPNGNVSIGSGSSVGGTASPAQIADHIHKGVPEPEFPTIDTDIFKPYATNVYTGGNTLVNAVIRANTNPNFAAGCTLQGVIYIETPNVITFRGNTNIQGVVVVQNNPTGDLTTNILDFRGNITASGVQTLPESFGDLRKLTGSVVLAPNFHVRFSGNFGELNGSLIGGKHTFDGNASGIIKGSIINLDDTQLLVKASSAITIASTGTTNYPAGVYLSSHYVPLPDTYTEVQP